MLAFGAAWHFCGLVGVAYNYLVRISIKLYAVNAGTGAGKVSAAFPHLSALRSHDPDLPAACGEGLGVFPQMEKRRGSVFIFMDFSCCKIVLYRFCYGSGIPAGLMVPLLCVGGVAGGLYADFCSTSICCQRNIWKPAWCLAWHRRLQPANARLLRPSCLCLLK